MAQNPLERSRIFSEHTILNMRRRHDKAIRKRGGNRLLITVASVLVVLIALVTAILVTVAVTRPF
jgi:hypothetical protein